MTRGSTYTRIDKPIKCDYCDRTDAQLFTRYVKLSRDFGYDSIVAVCPEHREELKQ